MLVAIPAVFRVSYLVMHHFGNRISAESEPSIRVIEALLLLSVLVLTGGATALNVWIQRYYNRTYGIAVLELSEKIYLVLGALLWLVVMFFCIIADGMRPQLSLTALWMAALFFSMYFAGPRQWHYLPLSLLFVVLVRSWGRLSELRLAGNVDLRQSRLKVGSSTFLPSSTGSKSAILSFRCLEIVSQYSRTLPHCHALRRRAFESGCVPRCISLGSAAFKSKADSSPAETRCHFQTSNSTAFRRKLISIPGFRSICMAFLARTERLIP